MSLEYMRMLSRYTMTQTSSMLAKMVLTNHWNAAGVLVRLKGITSHS